MKVLALMAAGAVLALGGRWVGLRFLHHWFWDLRH